VEALHRATEERWNRISQSYGTERGRELFQGGYYVF
jgi:hypothetical protein